ncbi:ABC transporter ATP-binding protein [Acidipropionibacterium jensenii]|uniref:ABC transporter ATP-binding protein n=1 Tax=Acidipropionibacterium jensenii TaxID=1749 RepID=UPI00110BFB67|nr:ABC transporter ATP-binding protein [Acidipropionibacterium jensenii]MDN5976573.1 ATP-binding cassette domain-containing protein [Acidipropionibacterium jensenii]MDN5995441.1 ATP-binding cassette domain-containing protein [Acidipropionibacterium jensenii]MDN6425988.1 ATP-binding cassette domain-containing protein [Acidipropionibacterium jensenii]MDN6442428.1 ATP-binding cassette domain-containing protein [Acidipropionibacterium jensenii]MDN6481042.1 ATP-binding cassette domain-containing pr
MSDSAVPDSAVADSTAPEPVPELEASHLSLHLGRSRGGLQVLDDLSLKVRTGRRIGLVGESGSGKSTLLRVLAGLQRPDSGQVRFRGRSILGRRPGQLADLRADVALVLQDPRSSLDPRMSVARTITEPLRSPVLSGAAGSREQVRQRLVQVMTEVGLDPATAGRFPHEFSGGQRQRIAIARALVTRPDVLLADEPVSALDVSVRAQVLNLLTELVSARNLTMVFVSHDLTVVRHLCDEVAVMQHGAIVESGDLARVYADPQHRVTRELLAAVPRIRT